MRINDWAVRIIEAKANKNPNFFWIIFREKKTVKSINLREMRCKMKNVENEEIRLKGAGCKMTNKSC